MAADLLAARTPPAGLSSRPEPPSLCRCLSGDYREVQLHKTSQRTDNSTDRCVLFNVSKEMYGDCFFQLQKCCHLLVFMHFFCKWWQSRKPTDGALHGRPQWRRMCGSFHRRWRLMSEHGFFCMVSNNYKKNWRCWIKTDDKHTFLLIASSF